MGGRCVRCCQGESLFVSILCSARRCDEISERSGTVDEEVCWFAESAKQKLHPVGEKKASGLGLYDLVGNVLEWCAKDPVNFGESSIGAFNREVTRGGSYQSSFPSCCSSARTLNLYTLQKRTVGFRLVCHSGS